MDGDLTRHMIEASKFYWFAPDVRRFADNALRDLNLDHGQYFSLWIWLLLPSFNNFIRYFVILFVMRPYFFTILTRTSHFYPQSRPFHPLSHLSPIIWTFFAPFSLSIYNFYYVFHFNNYSKGIWRSTGARPSGAPTTESTSKSPKCSKRTTSAMAPLGFLLFPFFCLYY